MKLTHIKFCKNSSTVNLAFGFLSILLIPIIISSVFSYALNKYYMKQYESNLISASSSDMNYFLRNTEEKLNNLYSEATLIFDEKYLENISNSSDNTAQFNAAAERYLTNNSFLDSISIISISKRTVYTSQQSYDADYYFENVYKYADYDLDSFISRKPMPNNRTIFAPTNVTVPKYNSNFYVIPLLFTPVTTNADKIVILNLSAQKLFDDFSSFHFTDNNIHYILSNSSSDFLSNSNYPLLLPDIDRDNTVNRYCYTTNTQINGKNYLVICSKSNFSLLGYTFAIAIPRSDIKEQSRHIYTNTVLILFTMILFLLIYAIFAATRISTPWSKLAETLKLTSPKGFKTSSTITEINHSISNLVANNDNLNTKLTTILPLSQQRFITEILNSPTTEPDNEMYRMIFEKDYFSAIAIKIFSRTDDLVITSSLNNSINIAIESVFLEKFSVFRLPSTDNTLYLLLNVDESCKNEEVTETVQQIKDLFKADEEVLNIYIGMGPVLGNIDGLRQTHREALDNLTNAINKDRIQTNTPLRQYSVMDNNDNTLFNYLMANYTDKAANLLDEIFAFSANKSIEYKNTVYTQVFNTLTRVLRIKGIRHPDISDDEGDAMLKHLLTKSDEDICIYMKELIKSCNGQNMPSLKLDITNVIKYIQDHFKEDISLEYIADANHVSVPYLSKRLKQSLDISFKEYLTQLRVDEAKRLLCSSQVYSIQDIAEKSGFYSNSSFTRTFKKSTGLSPSEYRTLYKK